VDQVNWGSAVLDGVRAGQLQRLRNLQIQQQQLELERQRRLAMELRQLEETRRQIEREREQLAIDRWLINNEGQKKDDSSETK